MLNLLLRNITMARRKLGLFIYFYLYQRRRLVYSVSTFASFLTNRRWILFGWLYVHLKADKESGRRGPSIRFLLLAWRTVPGCGFREIPLGTGWLTWRVLFHLFPFFWTGSKRNAACGCNHKVTKGERQKFAENSAMASLDPWTKLQNHQIKAIIYSSFSKPLLLDSLMFSYVFNIQLAQYPLLLGKKRFVVLHGNRCNIKDRGGDRDGRLGGHWTHLPPRAHRKYIYMNLFKGAFGRLCMYQWKPTGEGFLRSVETVAATQRQDRVLMTTIAGGGEMQVSRLYFCWLPLPREQKHHKSKDFDFLCTVVLS